MAEWSKVSEVEENPELIWSDKQRRILSEGKHFKVQVGQDAPHIQAQDWYRGDHINFWPSKTNLSESNAVYDYLLKGFVPEAPFIKKTDHITAFGSCFAHYIRIRLNELGYPTYLPTQKQLPIVHMPEGLNTTFALVQQFEWAWENKYVPEGLWLDAEKNYFTPTEDTRLETRQIFDSTNVFILTIGLSEIWFDKNTSEVFWRGVPLDKFDSSKHGFRVSTVDENVANLRKICFLIRKYRPDATIILTLSPVPLFATFRDIPCTAASSVSKAILRTAIDVVYQEYKADGNFFYWPAYEIVKEFNNSYDLDNRHVSEDTRTIILENFEKYFLLP